MEPNLLESEFSDIYNQWKKEPSPANNTLILKAVNPVLTSAIKTYGFTGSPTLQGRAKIMALDAIKKYDPTKAKLRTHLMAQLQGLRRAAAREQQILSVPEKVGLDIVHLKNAENDLRDQLARDPSDVELSDYLKLPIKRIKYIRNMRKTYAEGQIKKITDEGEDYAAPSIESTRGIHQWHNLVYHDLHPIDQVIMEHTLGMNGKPILSNKELAIRLNISPGAISQRKSKIQDKLNLRDTFGVF